jgi:hypothetical protein
VAVEEFAAFEAAAERDGSVGELEVLDSFDGVVLCRVVWNESVVTVVDAFAATDGSVLDTYTTDEGWYLRMQFADREALKTFRTELEAIGVSLHVVSLTTTAEREVSESLPYGLTGKQTEALLRAWEAGYYEIPRETTLQAVASAMDISQQALSERLQRAHATLLASTVARTLTDGGWDIDLSLS